ncbi:MAG: hypothetical protein E7361_02725 [Clostridiales bacterium]|nr:hypothetical protein [Clostridiales bacterium]
MGIIKEFIHDYRTMKHVASFNKALENGEFKPFDDDFYHQFDGKYFNGLPVRYYLQQMNMGKCYDASAILALALGNDDNYVVRGELAERSKLQDDHFGHGWVETEDGKVLDTTWQIIADKDAYYRVFGVKGEGKRTAKQFFEDCKGMSDWTIHDKEYYENNYVPLMYPMILGAYSLLKMNVEKSKNEKERSYYAGLLSELPDIEKVPSIPDIEME